MFSGNNDLAKKVESLEKRVEENENEIARLLQTTQSAGRELERTKSTIQESLANFESQLQEQQQQSTILELPTTPPPDEREGATPPPIPPGYPQPGQTEELPTPVTFDE